MAKTWKFCRRCGRPTPPGARCGCARPDRGAEPWRSSYAGAAYRRARAQALDATGGRCARCGAAVADRDGAAWRMRRGAGVHHRVPLRSGGSDEPGNLEPLCGRCHALADAALRRADRAR